MLQCGWQRMPICYNQWSPLLHGGAFSIRSLDSQHRFPSRPCRTLYSCRNSSAGIFSREVLMLGIETSCDDTGVAVVRGDGEILSEVVSSQTALLAQYGGVFPKMAQEGHIQAIDKVVAEAFSQAMINESNLTAVAVTVGPGLSLCLQVGVKKARTIARENRLPLVCVHHMEAHALIARLTHRGLQFPFVVLLVSGGHSLLLLAQNVGDYIQLGTTVDDAIGEAYDKTARLLGLDMTKGGGQAVEELALEGDDSTFNFTVPMRGHCDCNFSFAGLKTQVKLAIESEDIKGGLVSLENASNEDRQIRANIAASFQRVAVLHLEEKCSRAIEWAKSVCPDVKALVVSGGVASNKLVRKKIGELSMRKGLVHVCPLPRLCTDNGLFLSKKPTSISLSTCFIVLYAKMIFGTLGIDDMQPQ